MKKIVLITTIVVVIGILALCIVQSTNDNAVTKIMSKDITTINVISEAYEISVRPSKDDNLYVTINEDNEQYVQTDFTTLNINIPLSDKLINLDLSRSTVLIIEIPESRIKEFSIISKVGDITLEKIKAEDFTVQLENGNIKLIGMEGSLSAKAQIGGIKTTLPVSKEIVFGDYEIGASLDCKLGDESPEQILKITTTHGNIEIE